MNPIRKVNLLEVIIRYDPSFTTFIDISIIHICVLWHSTIISNYIIIAFKFYIIYNDTYDKN